jgi:hypothetical protein
VPWWWLTINLPHTFELPDLISADNSSNANTTAPALLLYLLPLRLYQISDATPEGTATEETARCSSRLDAALGVSLQHGCKTYAS